LCSPARPERRRRAIHRQKTFRPLLPVLPLHFLIITSQRHLAASQRQNVNSRPSGRSVSLALTNDTKVLARLGLPRKRKRKLPRKSKRVFFHCSPVFCLPQVSMFALLAFQSTWHQPPYNTHVFRVECKLLNSANV